MQKCNDKVNSNKSTLLYFDEEREMEIIIAEYLQKGDEIFWLNGYFTEGKIFKNNE